MAELCSFCIAQKNRRGSGGDKAKAHVPRLWNKRENRNAPVQRAEVESKACTSSREEPKREQRSMGHKRWNISSRAAPAIARSRWSRFNLSSLSSPLSTSSAEKRCGAHCVGLTAHPRGSLLLSATRRAWSIRPKHLPRDFDMQEKFSWKRTPTRRELSRDSVSHKINPHQSCMYVTLYEKFHLWKQNCWYIMCTIQNFSVRLRNYVHNTSKGFVKSRIFTYATPVVSQATRTIRKCTFSLLNFSIEVLESNFLLPEFRILRFIQ